MNVSPRFLALILSVGAAACSSPSNNPTDGGTDASKDVTVKETGAKDTGPTGDAAGDGGGPTATIDPLCAAPSTPPSGGSCIPADAGLPCNPVTNANCNADAGEACDFNQNTGFSCYPPPPPNTQGLCQTCDDQNTACLPGSTCLPASDAGGVSECAKFCCDDGDCGDAGGHCDKTTFQSDPLGFCVK